TAAGPRYVAGRFVIRRNREVGFDIPHYDASQPLIIDPTLVYSTYVGGISAGPSTGIAVDAAGNTYLAGQVSGGGTTDAVVMKINAAGTAVLYTTYVDGRSHDDANGIAADAARSAYIHLECR